MLWNHTYANLSFQSQLLAISDWTCTTIGVCDNPNFTTQTISTLTSNFHQIFIKAKSNTDSYPGRTSSFDSLKVAVSFTVSATPINSISFQSRVRKNPVFGVSMFHDSCQVRFDFIMGSLTTIPRAAGASARMERNERCIFGLRIQF